MGVQENEAFQIDWGSYKSINEHNETFDMRPVTDPQAMSFFLQVLIHVTDEE